MQRSLSSNSFKLGRIAGIDIGVHWSWLFIYVLLTWSLGSTLFDEEFPGWTASQRWLAGLITASLFFMSILLHEISHALMARRLGLPVHSITLFIFGGVSSLGREPDKPRDEFLIAIVGPGTSFLLAVVFGLAWLFADPASHLISVVCGYLALVNFSLGVFNMLPGFPLDGGRVFRAMVWGRKHDLLQATRIASIVGVGVAYLMILAGVVVTFWAAFISGIWLIFIGWFLKNMSEASYQQMVLHQVLEGMPVSSLARDSTVAVLPQTTLRELADEYILRRGLRYFPVVSEAGVLLGLISLTDLQHVPDSQWPETTVYRAMTPRERLVALSPSDDAVRAFELMVDRDVHQLPVLESDDRLLGFVTRAQLLDLIRNRVQLGQPGGASLKT